MHTFPAEGALGALGWVLSTAAVGDLWAFRFKASS